MSTLAAERLDALKGTELAVKLDHRPWVEA